MATAFIANKCICFLLSLFPLKLFQISPLNCLVPRQSHPWSLFIITFQYRKYLWISTFTFVYCGYFCLLEHPVVLTTRPLRLSLVLPVKRVFHLHCQCIQSCYEGLLQSQEPNTNDCLLLLQWLLPSQSFNAICWVSLDRKLLTTLNVRSQLHNCLFKMSWNKVLWIHAI